MTVTARVVPPRMFLGFFSAGGGVRRRWRHPHLSVRRADLRLVRQEHGTENVRAARGSG